MLPKYQLHVYHGVFAALQFHTFLLQIIQTSGYKCYHCGHFFYFCCLLIILREIRNQIVAEPEDFFCFFTHLSCINTPTSMLKSLNIK